MTKTTKEMIKIMQAYERGEQIEFRMKTILENDEWDTMTQEPEWNWTEFDYRVKQKPTYRPYKNAAEFLTAQKEHGMNLRLSGHNYYGLPLYITDILIGIQWPQSNGNTVNIDVSYEGLLRDYTWQDGTPCGVKES